MSDQSTRSIANVACLAPMALLMLMACNAAYTPSASTETGNPPVIDSSAVALVVTSDSVHVRGEAGAVMPPEGEIEVTNISNDAVETGPVESDGSFDIEVNGSVNDVFEVRVVWNGERSDAVYVIRGGAAIGEGDGGTLSCDQRQSLAVTFLDDAAQDADRSCEVDADCDFYVSAAPCLQNCRFHALSAEGRAELAAWESEFVEGICVENGESVCSFPAPECESSGTPTCQQGQCTSICSACLPTHVEWRITSPGVFPAEVSNAIYTLTGCNDFSVTAPGAGSCSAQVTQCYTRGSSIEDLVGLLADPEVASAFERGGEVGEPEQSSGFVYEITVGGTTVIFRSCANQQGSECAPYGGFDRLRSALDLIASEYSVSARSECGGAECGPQLVGIFTGICEDPGPAPFVWDGLACRACACCDVPYMSEEDCNAAYAGCDVRPCGGLSGGGCEADEYCAYVPAQGCGVLDRPASCQPRPEACDAELDRVCGCDNETYGNYCEASLAGMGIQAIVECEAL